MLNGGAGRGKVALTSSCSGVNCGVRVEVFRARELPYSKGGGKGRWGVGCNLWRTSFPLSNALGNPQRNIL